MTPFFFKYELYRNILLIITVLSSAIVISKYFIFPLIKRKKADFFAIMLEKVTPGINNLFINAVQLSGLSKEQVKKYGFSKDFIDLTIEEASEKAAEASAKSAVSARYLKKNLVTLSILSAVVMISYFSNPGFFKNTYAKFLYPEMFLEENALTTVEEIKRERLNVPEIGDFKIHYKYPAYTSLKDKTIDGSNGDIECLKGTQVTVSAKSDRPLKGVDFVFNNAQKVTAVIENATIFNYRVLALEPGTYHLEFDGIDYPGDFEHTLYQVIVEEDEYPFIKLLEPKEDFTVEENDEIRIAYEADDDFGIKEISLVIEREAGTETINIFKSDDDIVKEKSGWFTYKLSSLKLEPGEVLKVYLETYDNDTISGPKKSVSNERYLDVYSKEKKKREIAQMKERLFESLIDLLGDHFEKSLVNINLDSVDQVSDNQSRMNSKTSDIIVLIEEIINTIKEEDIEDDLSYIPLNNMRINIKDLFDDKDKLLKEITSDSYTAGRLKTDVDILMQIKEDEIKETEEDILFLDNENKKARMDDIIKEGEELLEAEKSLIEMLEELKETGDMSQAKEKLENILKEMEETFKKIADKLSKFPQSLPDEFVNSDSVQDLNPKEDMDTMEKLRESLKNNDIDEALKLAEELLNSMNKMMSSFEDSASEFSQNETTDQLEEIDNAINKLDELQMKQEELMKETKDINESAKEKRTEEQKKNIGDFIRKQQELVRQIRRDVRDVQRELRSNPLPKDASKEQQEQADQPSFHGRQMPPLKKDEDSQKSQKISQMLNEMPRMLMQDFNQAEKLAEDILKETKELRNGFDKEKFKERMKKPDSLERTKDKTDSALDKEEELLEAFNEFKEDADSFLSKEEKESLKKMSSKEGGLKESLDKLGKAMGEKEGSNPGLSDKGMKDAMEGAGESMGKAQQSLKSGKASGTLPHQGDALSKLGGAKSRLQQIRDKMMEQMGEGQAFGTMPGGMQGKDGMPQGSQPDRGREHSDRGRGVNVDDVNIPSSEEYRVPKEFREDILKGMKEKYPKEYEDKVKKYYEELIR
jgi:hypothetical protein